MQKELEEQLDKILKFIAWGLDRDKDNSIKKLKILINQNFIGKEAIRGKIQEMEKQYGYDLPADKLLTLIK